MRHWAGTKRQLQHILRAIAPCRLQKKKQELSSAAGMGCYQAATSPAKSLSSHTAEPEHCCLPHCCLHSQQIQH